ncbi:MAG: alpha/beta fold hydrolase [Bryobacterales bacterium]
MPVIDGESERLPGWARPYRPWPGGGDLQTIMARYWPASADERRWPAVDVYLDTVEGVRVLAKEQDQGGERTLLCVHGLTACTEARYMMSLAGLALERGWNVIRLNVRNCGGTEALCPTLYHSGLTEDLHSVIAQLAPRPLWVLGFSMGGHMVLKLAGEWGAAPPEHVRGVCGISVPIRLADCSRRIGERRNFIYEKRFLRQLDATLALKKRLMPQALRGIDSASATSIWDFDDRVTAPAFGFAGAADYYAKASSSGFLSDIAVPALLIQAEDDPFIPFAVYEDEVFERNSNLTLLKSKQGGHVAFLARGGHRFWAEEQAIRWFESLP